MRTNRLLIIISTILLFFSCATGPDDQLMVPDWFQNPPSDNNETMYFAISARASVLKDIEVVAGRVLFKEIAELIKISEEEADREDLSDFKDGVINLFKGGKADGFSVIEKQIYQQGADNVFYGLVSLKKKQINIIEEELIEILTAGSTAAVLSGNADELVNQGRFYEGILEYLKAASESAESDNRFVVEKNLSSALAALEKMTLSKGDSPETIFVGSNGIFSAVISGEYVPVKVTFRDRKKGSVIGDRFASLRSDADGLVSFIHPSPGFTGGGRVEIALDLFRDFESFENLDENFSSSFQKIREKSESLKVSFDFEIKSSAHMVSTGILIADTDFVRKALESEFTAEGVLNTLVDNGFDVSLMSMSKAGLLNSSEIEFLRDLPYLADTSVKRVIFGVAQIREFDESANGYTVVTEAEIKVVNLDSGEILFSEILSKRVQGGESLATINTSFKELGRSIAALLVDKLP